MAKRVEQFKSSTLWAVCLMCLLICPIALCVPAATGHEKEKKNTYIGVDLGAAHIRVAAFRDGKIDVLPVEQARQFNPQYIAFTNNGVLFGEAAKFQAEIDPSNAVFGVRHLIGRRFSEIEAEIENLPFKVIAKENKPLIEIDLPSGLKHFSPEELYSLILSKTKETAKTYLGADISMAVITIPSSFNDHQQQATKTAANLAGLHIPRLITEPVAAGIAHQLDMNNDERIYLVYDLDHETLGLHIVVADMGQLDVISSTNDITLASDVQHVTSQAFPGGQILGKHGFGLNLSTIDSRKATLATDELFHASLPLLKQALISSRLVKKDIDGLIIVGDSSHTQELRPLLERYLRVKSSRVVEPANSHAVGAAIQARVLFEGDGINGFLDLTVCPLSFGIETTGGIMTEMIHRHTVIPTHNTGIFTTAVDNQTTVVIKLYQGERVLTRDNILLGKFELSLPPSLRGVPVIEVTTYIDPNFILNVTARDLGSGVEETMIIRADESWNNFDMIKFLLMQSETFHLEDDVLRSLIQSTNAIDGHITARD